MLINCIHKLGKQISSTDRAELEDLFAKHSKDKSEYEASMATLVDYHKNLFDQVNEMRTHARLKPAAYKPYEAAEAIPSTSPAKPSPRSKGERPDMTLSQHLRAGGGMKTKMLRGELSRLGPKEAGTTGLLNQKSGQPAEWAMQAANEAGFRDLNGQPFEHIADYIDALESDIAKGVKKRYQKMSEGAQDFTAAENEYYAHQEAAQKAEEARTNLLESGRGAELFDKIIERKATDAEHAELNKLAQEAGLSSAEIEDIIAAAREEGGGVEATGSERPANPPQQLGFVPEGLEQQVAPPPKPTSQRDALIQAEKVRAESADPERTAALKTLEEIRRRGMTVDDYARQGSLLSEAPSPEKLKLLRELESSQPAAPAQSPDLFSEPSFVTSAKARLAEREAHIAKGGEYRGSGGPDTQVLIDNIIVRGWDLYSEKIKPTFEEWSRKIREEFGPESDSHLQKVWAQLGGERHPTTLTTEARHAKVDADRTARGLEPFPKAETKKDEQLLADAEAANTADPRAVPRLADQVLNGGKGQLSDTETAQFDLHIQALKNEYDAINRKIGEAADSKTIKELTDRADVIEREMSAAEEAETIAGSEWGRAGRARRLAVGQDFRELTLVAGRKKGLGRDLTAAERSQVKNWADKYAELEVKLAESNERAEKAEAVQAVGKIKADVARENRRAGRGLKRQSLDAEAAELKQLISQAWKKQRGGEDIHSAMGLAKLDPEGVVTKLVVQLARNRLEAQIGLKAEALVDEVHGLLKDAVDLSRRDVAEMISGYGKTFEMSQDAVDTRLRELKSIIAANLGKADIIEKGIRPLRRGLQRDKPTQEVRAAMRDLRDTLREHGMQVERSKGSPEEQQQSALDAAKTRARNRIEDLNKWIKDGKRTVADKTEIIPDAELKGLQGERDRLQKVFEAIDDPAADQKKIENTLRTVSKSVGDLEAKIRSGDLAVKQRTPGLTSPELEAARAEQKALRGILNDLRNAAKPEPSDIEREARTLLSANKALGTRMEKQIADLERRMAQGDFSKPAKREPVVYNRENLALQKQLEQVKREYSRANYKATRGRFGMITDELAKAANVPKTIKSMGDISAVFRQGGFYSLTHPIEGFAKPTAAMLQSFTETGYRNVENAIKNHPKFEQAKRDGVEFTGVDKTDPNLSHGEEGYFGGETIDVLASGKYNPLKVVSGVKNFSERTFISFLDSQRMHMYDTMTEGLKAQGLTPINAPESYKGAAKLINIGTGRGNLGKKGNQAAPFLNILMFSPRLVASRVQMLNNMFNPVAMARMPKGVRAQNIKDNVKFLAGTAAIMGLATAAGGTVNRDPDDADFLKIRFGKTTYDTLTGLQQPLRYIINMARAATGGETYPGQSMADLSTRFARSKESPLAGLATDYISGEDFQGRKFSAKRAALDTVTPLPVKDFTEAMQKEGLIKGFLKATPTLTGIGVQTYDERPDKPVTHAEKLARKIIRDKMPDESRDDDEIERDKKKAELRARARKGEDVTTELDKLELTKKQRKLVLGAEGKTRLQEDFNSLPTLEDAVTVYETMNADERTQNRSVMNRKHRELIGNLPKEKQKTVRDRLRKLGLLPPIGTEDIQRYFANP